MTHVDQLISNAPRLRDDGCIAWPEGPTKPVLTASAIHIWCARLDTVSQQLDGSNALLSRDELRCAGSYHSDLHRSRFVAARSMLRQLLSIYSGIEARALRFHYGKYGKPSLADPDPSLKLEFNLAHSNGFALYAFSLNQPLGIDLERIQAIPDLMDIASHFFSKAENVKLGRLDPIQRQQRFFQYWARREAVGKCVGEGLTESGLKTGVSSAHVEDLFPLSGYAAALATSNSQATLNQWGYHLP
ncbi:MAG: 4'-phosphopantetheinyl transferase superfamily protein [Opitutales bacterium]|nr:4'-phosphopantetheinyl transferase superfamily protein [Opitutales bacterium]